MKLKVGDPHNQVYAPAEEIKCTHVPLWLDERQLLILENFCILEEKTIEKRKQGSIASFPSVGS